MRTGNGDGRLNRAWLRFMAAMLALIGLPMGLQAEPFSTDSCRTEPSLGACLLRVVRASRSAEEMAWKPNDKHLSLIARAIEVLKESAPKDDKYRAELLLEQARALEIVGRQEEAKAAYQAVCPSLVQDPMTEGSRETKSSEICSVSALKIAVLDGDAEAVKSAARQLLHQSGVSGIQCPDSPLEDRTGAERRMLLAEGFAYLALANAQTDRSSALRNASCSLSVLWASAERVDETIASEAIEASLDATPQPWDKNADLIDPLPLVRRAAQLSERVFGAENPRNWDVLSQLQFQLWNVRFERLKGEVEKDRHHSDPGEDKNWDPLSTWERTVGGAPTSEDLKRESISLTKRLYAIALSEVDPNRQERHLESLESTLAAMSGMEAFAKEVLLKRAELVERAVSNGSVPPAVKWEAVAKVVENELSAEATRGGALKKLDEVTSEVQSLDDSSPQIGRALLALANARHTAVVIDPSSREKQVRLIAGAVDRAKRVMPLPNSGVSPADVFLAAEELKELEGQAKP